MTAKQYVSDMLKLAPDDISWDELRRSIGLLEQVENGMDEAGRGETVPHEQVVQEYEMWRAASIGRKCKESKCKR